MNTGRPLVAASAGLLLAVALIAGLTLAGAGSQHIDLIRAASTGSEGVAPSSLNGQTSGGTVTTQTGAVTTQSAASPSSPPVSSLKSLATQSASGLGLLLLPILLGAALGGIFFGAYSRRIERD
jgi:hypothetical protein